MRLDPNTEHRIIKEFIKRFRVLLLDSDGVWFTGHETRAIFGDQVWVAKTRHFHDGQGLSFLRALGIRILFVSGEGQPLPNIVAKLNDLPSVKNGSWAPIEVLSGKIGKGDKVRAIEEWLEQNHFSWADCIYMGDDVNDFPPMRKAALAVAPANCTRRIFKIAHIVTEHAGGNGALREFAELVLDERGVDELDLPPA